MKIYKIKNEQYLQTVTYYLLISKILKRTCIFMSNTPKLKNLCIGIYLKNISIKAFFNDSYKSKI